jgi:dipeptidyl aminopeptidase/acylaminoacyl peptidase
MKDLPKIIVGILVIIVCVFGIILFVKRDSPDSLIKLVTNNPPLNIEYMRMQNYPGSDIKIEQTLPSGSNYDRYIASYSSDGLKQYAYLTIPKTKKPAKGFPAIVFNHGYQIPRLYTPEGNYIPHMDALAKAGYVIFKPDFRGNGKSEGAPGSTYFSPNYAIDDLNAISSIKKYPGVNPSKIGLWGHSMGGNISLRVSEISPDIKAVVIWGAVVGDYNDIIYNWQDKVTYKPNAEDIYLRNLGLSSILAAKGNPSQNPEFWNGIDPTSNLKYITAPFQIHVGMGDNQVPPGFSKGLYDKLKMEKKYSEYYEYPGANHDINQSFNLAMKRTIEFFDKHLK